MPRAVTACSTWNPELYGAEGEAIGREALAYGVSVVLGPGCNIKRNPLGGRNFFRTGNAEIAAAECTAAAESVKAFDQLQIFLQGFDLCGKLYDPFPCILYQQIQIVL